MYHLVTGYKREPPKSIEIVHSVDKFQLNGGADEIQSDVAVRPTELIRPFSVCLKFESLLSFHIFIT